ncbi:extended synaptotagmin-3-like isoform X6 [Manis javanica]|uniref:extended synaptotagmin-3-like isoform X6 n=1 Tax=Manis javanica TaxID=9974 RepID=UPI003C6D18AC
MRRGGGGWGSVSPEPPCAAFRSHARRCQGRAWPARGGCSPIHFPDVERVQWANKIISQTWPYLSMIMENKVREKLEPKIQEKSAHLRTFAFTKLYFVPQDRVKVHTDKHNWRWVVLDLQICYIGDCEISVELQKLQGTLRIILEPLLVDKPFVGAVTMFFLQKPHLQINWTGLTNLLDALGISNASNGLLEDLIATYLVLPNRVTVPVKKGLDVTSLRFPLPCVIIRVHLLEAEKLAQKDSFLGIQGKSDPYTKVSIGLQNSWSRTVSKNLNPTWNEVFEFIVYEVPGQDLEVDLYDEDPDKDNFLGSLQICLGDVMTNRAVDEWFVLNGTTSRWLHLRLEWLSPITDPDALAKDQSGPSTAILVVFLVPATCRCWMMTRSVRWESWSCPCARCSPCTDLTLEQRFRLDHSGLDSLISMRLALRRRGAQAAGAGRDSARCALRVSAALPQCAHQRLQPQRSEEVCPRSRRQDRNPHSLLTKSAVSHSLHQASTTLFCSY